MSPSYSSLALLTDLYQLTMAYGYWKQGKADQEAIFHLYFRSAPFGGGYTVAAGMGPAVEYLEQFGFTSDDLAYLAKLVGSDGEPLFEETFLRYLQELRLTCDVHMVPEGTIVFPNQPLVRVRGPILQAQLVETILLNLVNFQTLIATKAARVVHAADGDEVLEFGLRRAQGIDGGLAASRAAYIGGCAATSNVLAGKLYGIPVKGTHAHSWVMLFENELESFLAYADSMPNNVVLLVDTYDTLEGVRNAIRVGERLREKGHRLAGIRLDSGDLAYYSIEARRLLDEAGLSNTAIVASNDLDEYLIQSLKREQSARISVWGVGTRLVTAFDQPALGGVYKLAMVREDDGEWKPRIKLSEQQIKVSNPGCLQVWRYGDGHEYVGDVIVDEFSAPTGQTVVAVDSGDPTRRKRLGARGEVREALLFPTLEGGRRVAPNESIVDIRSRVVEQLSRFHDGIKRFQNPHQYPAGLELGLFERKTQLILRARGFTED